jgi:hypothetical protein
LTFIEIGVIESNHMKRKSSNGRGGKREGAGRPSIGVRKVQLSLDDQTIDKGKNIGAGNLSLGVRIAVREHKKKPRPEKSK